MSLVNINWNPKRKELREFGIVILIGCAAMGGILFFKHPHAAYWMWGIGLIIGAAGLTGRYIARPFYLVWMGMAYAMGHIMSPILMGIIYYSVMTPLAFLIKLVGRDRLILRCPRQNSYWQNIKPHKADRASYQRQF